MSDIVERLRAEDGWVCNEGADEIERLTVEVASLKASCGYEAANQLTADNERLRAALVSADNLYRDHRQYEAILAVRDALKDTKP